MFEMTPVVFQISAEATPASKSAPSTPPQKTHKPVPARRVIAQPVIQAANQTTSAQPPPIQPITAPSALGADSMPGKNSDVDTDTAPGLNTAKQVLSSGPPHGGFVAPKNETHQAPSSNADYLNNPPPTYPALSRRLGEQGKVVIHVLIGKDGQAKQAEVRLSSGFERLDQAALNTVLGWRYSPGQINRVPQEMWFNVPVSFTLN